MTKKKKTSKKEMTLKDEDGNILKSEAFMTEETHPAIGRILTVNGKRFKILDEGPDPHTGTFIKEMDERDEEHIQEFDEDLEELSNKLVKKVDLKRMIKEQIKNKTHQEIKTGLFILKKDDEGNEVETTHRGGCYEFTMQSGELMFTFMSGHNVIDGIR